MTYRPALLPRRLSFEANPMDALSDVLGAVRLTGAVFFDVHAAEPWVAQTPPGAAIVHRIFPHADHLIPYHAIVGGSCWVTVLGEEPMHVAAGDVVMFPHGHAHVLSSDPGMRSKPDLKLYRRPDESHLPFSLTLGAANAGTTHIVCGFLGCDARPYNPLLMALPNAIHAKDSAGGTLAAYVQLALTESKRSRIGGQAVLGRLSELLFVEVVRRYAESLDAGRTDWLSGLRDPNLGVAITALHRQPQRDWTVQSLAREAGISRSVLAERFTEFVGVPPMQYLASWRMQLAANELRISTDSVATIANRVGYESEAAFSRAFTKSMGEPPGSWRKRQWRTA
jgi:AraC-like DNA-binding protein